MMEIKYSNGFVLNLVYREATCFPVNYEFAP